MASDFGLAGTNGNIPQFIYGARTATPAFAGDGVSAVIVADAIGATPTANLTIAHINGAGADYAEYLEWKDVPSSDMIGRFVTWAEGTQKMIRITQAGDEDNIGVISGVSGVIGNAAELRWCKSSPLDKFGRMLTEYVRLYDLRGFITKHNIDPDDRVMVNEMSEPDLDVMLDKYSLRAEFEDPSRKLPEYTVANPEWDPTRPYDPRSTRPEWAKVGMLGVIPVLEGVPGNLMIGDKGVPGADGKIYKSLDGKGYKVIARNAEDVVEIFLR